MFFFPLLYNWIGSFLKTTLSAFKTEYISQTPFKSLAPYKGTSSLHSFLSPLAPTIISVPSSPTMLEPSPAQPFSPPAVRSWHATASWEDTKIPLLAEVEVVLSSPLLCCSGVGAGALIPLLPAPMLPAIPAAPRLLVGGPQRKAWAGL